MTAATVVAPSAQKLAWQRIRERAERNLAALEAAPTIYNLFSGQYEPLDVHITFGSINDEIQAEYKSGRIDEPTRDAMREYVKAWLGDPEDERFYGTVKWLGVENGYDAYSCGLWAPSAKPWDMVELQFIHMTLVILEEESE